MYIKKFLPKSKIGNENKKIINSFNDGTLEKIISQNISRQYTRYEKNQNELICEAVKENKILYNILKDNHIIIIIKIIIRYKNPKIESSISYIFFKIKINLNKIKILLLGRNFLIYIH